MPSSTKYLIYSGIATAVQALLPLNKRSLHVALPLSAMNISLRQVKLDSSQTMFITSTGTVLFTSHTIHDPRGQPSSIVITSVDDQGSVVEVGLIKWNQNAGGSPSLCVGRGLMELRAIRRDDSL